MAGPRVGLRIIYKLRRGMDISCITVKRAGRPRNKVSYLCLVNNTDWLAELYIRNSFSTAELPLSKGNRIGPFLIDLEHSPPLQLTTDLELSSSTYCSNNWVYISDHRGVWVGWPVEYSCRPRIRQPYFGHAEGPFVTGPVALRPSIRLHHLYLVARSPLHLTYSVYLAR